jgi:hypothetical protein
MFLAYLLFVLAGLAFYRVVGALHYCRMGRFLRENSLSIAFGAAFLATLVAQSYTGYLDNNNDLAAHHEALFSYSRYLVSSDFGAAVMENWQSEFLAIGTMAVFSIYLRQRGSPESKPVGAPHDETGSS